MSAFASVLSRLGLGAAGVGAFTEFFLYDGMLTIDNLNC